MIARIIRSLSTIEADPPPWEIWSALNTVLVAVVALIAGAFIAFALSNDPLAAPLLGWLIGGFITIAYVWRSRRDQREALRLQTDNIRLYIVLLFGLGIAVLVDTLGLAITQEYAPTPELAALFGTGPGPALWLVAALFMLIVQPIFEELVFRGALFPSLRHALGGWLGWLLSAAAYALFHALIYPPGNLWMTLIQPFLAGLFFSGVRANTRRTSAAIAAHVGFNIFTLLKIIALPV